MHACISCVQSGSAAYTPAVLRQSRCCAALAAADCSGPAAALSAGRPHPALPRPWPAARPVPCGRRRRGKAVCTAQYTLAACLRTEARQLGHFVSPAAASLTKAVEKGVIEPPLGVLVLRVDGHNTHTATQRQQAGTQQNQPYLPRFTVEKASRADCLHTQQQQHTMRGLRSACVADAGTRPALWRWVTNTVRQRRADSAITPADTEIRPCMASVRLISYRI